MEDNNNVEIQAKLYELLIELDKVASRNKLKYNLAYGTALGAVRENGFIAWDTDLDIMVTIDEYERFCWVLESQIGERFCLYNEEKDKNYTALFTRMGFKNTPHYELHIDIFPMVGTPNNKLVRNIYAKLSNVIYLAYYMKRINIKKRLKDHKKVAAVVLIGKVVLFPIPATFLVYIHNKLRGAFSIKDSDYVYNICGASKKRGFIPKEWIEESVYEKFNDLELPVPKELHKYLSQVYGDYMTPKKQNYYSKD